MAGYLSNMGQGLIFTVDNSSKPSINLTGGPLSYKYEWHQMALHFGLNNQSGSEHMIAGRAFPAEVSVMGSYRRQNSIENRPRKNNKWTSSTLYKNIQWIELFIIVRVSFKRINF